MARFRCRDTLVRLVERTASCAARERTSMRSAPAFVTTAWKTPIRQQAAYQKAIAAAMQVTSATLKRGYAKLVRRIPMMLAKAAPRVLMEVCLAKLAIPLQDVSATR